MSPLTTTTRSVLSTILAEIAHLPGGYRFWASLPKKGRKSQHCLTRRWAALLTTSLFPVQLVQAALLASLTEDGVPDSRGRALYSWLLRVVYRGQAVQLHADWARLKDKVAKEPELLLKPKPKRAIVRPATMPRAGLYTWHEYPPSKVAIQPPTVT